MTAMRFESDEARKAYSRESMRRWRANNPDKVKPRVRTPMKFESEEARLAYNRARTAKYRERNPERAKESSRKSDVKRDHSARSKNWRLQSPEKREAYYEANKHKWTANENRRRAIRLKATPPWVDYEKIAEVYREAYEQRAMGLDVHVDHIVPLRGKLVCGLHVHTNLQIISARENLSKGNRHDTF